MIVLDTTVLVYAVGTDHAYREPCRSLVDAIAAGHVTATSTVEVIAEFAHVRARRRGRADARRLAVACLDLLSPLLTPSETDLRAGLEAWSAHEGLGAFDAVLARACLSSGADALVSADDAFSRVPDLPHLLPTASNVAGLLSRG